MHVVRKYEVASIVCLASFTSATSFASKRRTNVHNYCIYINVGRNLACGASIILWKNLGVFRHAKGSVKD